MQFKPEISSPVNWTNHLIDDYYVSDLVITFSKLTRYETNFKANNNATLMDEDNYAYAMVMYAVMAGIVAAGLTLFLLAFFCCNCLFRSAAKQPINKPPTSGRSYLCWNILVILLALLGAGTFIVGFIGESRLHNGAENVCHTINFTYGKVLQIDQESAHILSEIDVTAQLNQIGEEIANAEKHVASLPPLFRPNIEKQVAKFNELYKQISNQIHQATDTVKSKIKSDILPKIIDKLNPIDDKCASYVDDIRLVTLSALALFAVISLLFIVGLCHNCLRVTTSIIGYLFLLLIMLFGTISFVLLVAGSDFCLTSKTVVEKRIDEPALHYYLWCPESNYTTPSPTSPAVQNSIPMPTIPSKFDTHNLDHLFHQVRQLISTTNQTVVQFEQQLDGNITLFCTPQNIILSPELGKVCESLRSIQTILGTNDTIDYSLYSHLSKLIGTVSEVLDIVDCNKITPEINDTLTNVCTTLYEAFFYFLMNAATAALCFYILIFVSTWLLFL